MAEACLRGLKRRQFDPAVTDGMDGSVTSRGTLLAASIVFSRYLREHTPSRRVAVVLPPGRAAVVANAALMLAGKVPVNLNFTAGRAAIEAAIRIAGITELITAGPVIKRLPDFPWPERTLRIEEILPPLKKKIALWRVLVFLPWRLLAAWLRIPSKGDREEAVILFTSGSAGEPKGVVLSHRNLLGNVSQFSSMLELSREDAVLGCLPFFHSFGCTVTLWYPLIEGIRLVTYPNALDTAKNVELIHKHKVTLFISTPTFLRGYLRKAEPEQLASLKLLVTGAEKLPDELAKVFEETFNIPVQQGYGLTETSPVVSTNLPDPKKSTPADTVQPSTPSRLRRQNGPRHGRPDSRSRYRRPALPSRDRHALAQRPEYFRGLPQRSRPHRRRHQGWLVQDRRPRPFRRRRLPLHRGPPLPLLKNRRRDGARTRPSKPKSARRSKSPRTTTGIAVTGIPDESKGEALVLLSTIEIDPANLRAALNAMGIPNLWVPKRIQRVEAIPTLASGKLDLKAVRELALAAA